MATDVHPLAFPGFPKERDSFGPTFKITPVKPKPITDLSDARLFTITPPSGYFDNFDTTSLDEYIANGTPPSTRKADTPPVHKTSKPLTPIIVKPIHDDPDEMALVSVKRPLTPPVFYMDRRTPTPVEDNSMAIVPIKQVQYPGTIDTVAGLGPDMKKIAGYEGISFELTPAAPPSYDMTDPIEIDHMPTKRTETNLPEIKEYQVREALVKFAKKTCCYGATPAKEMVILDVNSDSIFHYTLDTFCEKRETSWQFEPYRTNVPISVGNAPGPWEIPVTAPKFFNDNEKILEVPNTSVVRQCHNCAGMGRKMCNVCHGKKKENCSKCYGSGLKAKSKDRPEAICSNCTGTGKLQCKKCSGKGHRPCKICVETGNLRFFVRLKVEWKTHSDDKITESILIPISQVREATGEVAFEEVGPKVTPIKYFPDEAVNVASQTLVNEHHSAFPVERILQQRQRVRIIPLAEVSYSWKNRQGKFFVYGFENKVYFTDYPQKYCWGCTIS